jgi:hypothetical protein
MEELGSGDVESLINKIENEKELFKDFIDTDNNNMSNNNK